VLSVITLHVTDPGIFCACVYVYSVLNSAVFYLSGRWLPVQRRLEAVNKVCRAQGEGVREGVTEEGSKACDITLLKSFIIHMKPEFESDD